MTTRLRGGYKQNSGTLLGYYIFIARQHKLTMALAQPNIAPTISHLPSRA